MSKSVHLTPDIVEYDPGASKPLYNLIIGKQSLHDIVAVLDFKDKTMTNERISSCHEEYCQSAAQT